jgi:hypothetical protein
LGFDGIARTVRPIPSSKTGKTRDQEFIDTALKLWQLEDGGADNNLNKAATQCDCRRHPNGVATISFQNVFSEDKSRKKKSVKRAR